MERPCGALAWQQRSGREATTNALRCKRGNGGGGGGGGGRHSRAETARKQAQQGRNSTLLCSITAILVRNRGLGTARFAERAAGAGGCLRRPLTRRELAPTEASCGAEAKNGPAMREFTGIMGRANRRVGAGCWLLTVDNCNCWLLLPLHFHWLMLTVDLSVAQK